MHLQCCRYSILVQLCCKCQLDTNGEDKEIGCSLNQDSAHQRQRVSRTDLWKHDWSRCLAGGEGATWDGWNLKSIFYEQKSKQEDGEPGNVIDYRMLGDQGVKQLREKWPIASFPTTTWEGRHLQTFPRWVAASDARHSNVLIVNCCFWRRSFLLQSTLKKHKTFRWKVGRGWHEALSDLNAWLVEPELNTNHILSPKPH